MAHPADHLAESVIRLDPISPFPKLSTALQSFAALALGAEVQLPTESAGEKEVWFRPSPVRAPCPESLYRRPSKRSAALLSPFTFATDVGTATQVDVTLSESDEFRDPKLCLNGEQQQAAISSARSTRRTPALTVHNLRQPMPDVPMDSILFGLIENFVPSARVEPIRKRQVALAHVAVD
jgi:hypothetical protein